MGDRVLTDGTELGVVFANAFDGMHLHVDLLSRAQLCKHDIRVRRCGWVRGHDRPLFALWDPLELRREDLRVGKECLGVRRVFRRVFYALTGSFEAEHERVPIRRLIVLCCERGDDERVRTVRTCECSRSFKSKRAGSMLRGTSPRR